MPEFLKKIKDKLFPKLEEEQEEAVEEGAKTQDENEEIEVQEKAPEVASAKKNKITVIAASSLLITGVLYFLFFSNNNQPKQQLEPVTPVINPQSVARSDENKSPFELDDLKKDDDKKDDDAILLEKPQTPDVPKLPELAASDDKKDDLILPEDITLKQPEQKAAALEIPENKPLESAGQNQAQATPPTPPQNLTDPKYAPILVLQGQGGPSRSVGYDQNIKILNGDPIRSLEKSTVNVKTTFVEDRSNVVAQGKMVTAVLETAINTEVPGSVRAIVSRDVYGEAGKEILISRGSRLFGTYSTETLRGQARVQINWTRLIRPDGVDMAISSSASDQFGRAGIEGEVDNKYSSVVANSILTSILAVGGVAAAEGLIGGNNSNTTTTSPSTGTTTTTAKASTQAIYDASKNITGAATRFVDEYFDTRPIIRVPQGTRITVIVNSDIKVPSLKK